MLKENKSSWESLVICLMTMCETTSEEAPLLSFEQQVLFLGMVFIQNCHTLSAHSLLGGNDIIDLLSTCIFFMFEELMENMLEHILVGKIL